MGGFCFMLARDIEMFIEHCGLKGLSTKTINGYITKYRYYELKNFCLQYEPISERYFHATEIELTDAFYNMNRDFALNGEVTMNNLYNYLGLDYIPEGDTTGWCSDYLANEWEYYWIDFHYYKRTTDDGLEVYYVEAFQPPVPAAYRKLH